MEVILLARLYKHDSMQCCGSAECFIVHDHTFQVKTEPDPNPAPDPALKLGKLKNKRMY
jgi:hypothetical protein